MADSPEAVQNGLRSRLMNFLSKAKPAELAEILGDASAVSKGGLAPELSHAVDDNWTDNKATAVGENLNIASTGQAARGNEASPAAAHSDKSAQMGIEAVATKLGEMINGMGGLAKAVKSLQENAEIHTAALISLATHVAKSDATTVAAKAEDGKEKGKEDEKDTPETKKEFGKSAIDAVLAEIAPLVETAKINVAKAAEMTAAGMAGSAAFVQLTADEATLKASKLFEAAKALDPAHPKVVELAKSIDALKPKTDGSVAKTEEAPVATVEKGLTSAEREAVEKALTGQGLLTASVSKLMDVLSGKTTVGEIAKAMPKVEPGKGATTLQGLHEIIIAKSAAGELDPNEVAEANNLAAIFDGEQRGEISKGIFEMKSALAPDRVRQIFVKAA